MWVYIPVGNAASFTRVSQDFAGIVDNYTRRAPSFAIADLNNNGREELAVADNSGIIRVIENFNTTTPIEHTRTFFNPITEKEDSARFGSYNQLAVASLAKGEPPYLAVGNVQGGVYLLKNAYGKTGGDQNRISLEVYPNPVSGSMMVDPSLVNRQGLP
jgi:hypothetical protein